VRRQSVPTPAPALVALALAAGLLAGAAATRASWPPLALHGGDVRAIAFDPAEPERALAGTASGQLYRSDDGGARWRDAGALVPFPGWVVAALEFDAARKGRLWAALWSLGGPGGGVAFSDDLGAHWAWRAAKAWADDPVYAVATVPGRPDRLFAGSRRGVWRSDDAGASWRLVSAGADGLVHVSSLAVDPRSPERVLAGTWRRAYRSEDGGASWRGVFEGMVLDTELFTLEPVPGRPGELWASTCGWVYLGEEFGARWSRKREGLAERRTPALAVPAPGHLVAGTVAGVYLSEDAGASFRRTSDPELAAQSLAFHPRRPERLLLGTDGAGIWRSTDGGRSFAPASAGLAGARVAAVVAERGAVYAALAFAGPLSGVYRSGDRGASFERLGALPGSVSALAIAEGELLAATERGLFVRSGAEWRPAPGAPPGRIESLERAGAAWRVRADGRRFLWRGGRLVDEPLGRGAPAAAAAGERRLGTGDARWPWLRLGADGARLSGATGGAAIALPFSHDAVLGAAVDGDRLLLATSGFGLRAVKLAASGAVERVQDAQVGGEALGGDLAP
jgi:photosystem II stability/assembly factor-like uncharacterized protein